MSWVGIKRAVARAHTEHFGDGAKLTVYDSKQRANVATGIGFSRHEFTSYQRAEGLVGKDSSGFRLDVLALGSLDLDTRHKLILPDLTEFQVIKTMTDNAGGGAGKVTVEAKE